MRPSWTRPAPVHWTNVVRCVRVATSRGRTCVYRWPHERRHSILVAACQSSVNRSAEMFSSRYIFPPQYGRICSTFKLVNTHFIAVLADDYQARLLKPQSYQSRFNVFQWWLVHKCWNAFWIKNCWSHTVRQFPGTLCKRPVDFHDFQEEKIPARFPGFPGVLDILNNIVHDLQVKMDGLNRRRRIFVEIAWLNSVLLTILVVAEVISNDNDNNNLRWDRKISNFGNILQNPFWYTVKNHEVQLRGERNYSQ